MVLELKPVYLPMAEVRWRGLELMRYQADAFARASAARLLIEAPTGGGKTWAGAAPLLEGLPRGEGALFVYPTNALADDQRESLVALGRRAGYRVACVRSDGSLEGDAQAELMIWRLHGGEIDAAERAVGGRRRGETVARVLERLPAKPLWLVTNPDTVHLLCTARYALAPTLWSRLETCRSLVLDEFHLYRGPTLVRALVMMELARTLLGTERIRVLSATLPSGARALLEGRLCFERVVAMPSDDGRPVQHRVLLETSTSSDPTAEMTERIRLQVCDLRSEVADGMTVPLVVLRQSVLAAIHLEDELVRVRGGLQRDEIGVYRGLSSRAIRSMEKKAVVVGTSALEVGVDFRTRRLFFEARAPTSFVQRLGRVGRHEKGVAVFFTDSRVARVLDGLGQTADHATLAKAIEVVLAPDDALDGFVESPWGSVLGHSIFDGLLARGVTMGAGLEFKDRVEAARAMLSPLFGSEAAPGTVSRAVRSSLQDGAAFRGGSASVEVFDRRELERRGRHEFAVFDVDLRTFFRRAEWVNQPDADARPIVVGWRKPRRLSLGLSMTTAGVGLHAPVPEQIELRVDGQATAWERLLREEPHIVGLFPQVLRGRLSWREIVFESDDGRIALLDDDALVASFMNSSRA